MVFKISATSKMSDPVDKHVIMISLEEKFKYEESELDDTASSEELRDVRPTSPPNPFLENNLIHDEERQIDIDAVLGDGSGNIIIDLHGPRDMGFAHNDQLEVIGGNYNNFPIRSNMFLPADVETAVEMGYISEKAPKNRSPAPASPKTKPPGDTARRKRKRAEDPKTYVPLTLRGTKGG